MRTAMMWSACLNNFRSIKMCASVRQLFSFLFLLPLLSIAQEGTRSSKSTSSLAGKVMIIPFEPKLYLSEIDQKINQQTKWNFNQIRENFRHQLDVQLQQKFKNYGSVISFYSDSIKMHKDLQFIYVSTSISFDPLDKPRSGHMQATKSTGIKDGQVTVEISSEKKFTNIVPNDDKILPYLSSKYKAEYFVFINQLDIKNNADSYNIATDSYLRKVDVHYTIVDKTGKLITAGIASSGFSSKENNPKNIVALAFSPIATFIFTKFATLMKPVTEQK